MKLNLSAETQKLLDEEMKKGRFTSPDDAVRTALLTLDQVRGEDIEDMDEQTQAALERAFAQSERGEARPWEAVRDELKAKYPSK
jgi:Arc/MetJ-type ribon-helix-helix transcriptional regulator